MPRLTLAFVGLFTIVLTVACSSPTPTPTPEPTPTPTVTPTPTLIPTPTPTALPTPEPTPRPKPTLFFGGLSWSSAAAQTEIARVILENGFGYETEVLEDNPVALMQGLARGEVNVIMEIWLPAQQAEWDDAAAAETVELLGGSLADKAWQSAFIIPQYTADANPGLRSVEDLKQGRYWSLFRHPSSGGKAGLITCIPGWSCEARNEQQVYGYGLENVVELINPGSLEALNAEILGAFENEENLLFYYWAPTALMAKLETQYGGVFRLKEPASTRECEDYLADNREADNTQSAVIACGYADADVLVAVSSELRDTAPDAVAFLERYQLSGEGINTLLVRLDESGDEYADVAAWWLQTSDEWKAWVSSDVADAVLAAL